MLQLSKSTLTFLILSNKKKETTMMSTAAAATELSNIGVQAIVEGDYRQAISVLKRGISIVRQELAASQYNGLHRCEQQDTCTCTTVSEESHSLRQDEEEDGFIPSCPFHKLSTESSSPPLTTSSSEKGDETMIADNQEPFIFKDPIIIPTTEHGAAVNGCTCYNKHCVKLSFILLYNMALANYLLALHDVEQGVVSEKRLQTARGLYELVYTLQLTEMDIQPTALQVMAIVNNLGQVHMALGNHDQARECFANLLCTLVFYADNCNEQHDDDGDNHREQLDGFLCNVLPLIFAKGSQPASAA
jgi:tetratricopeptide (TPR) repeat protein